VSAIEEFRKEMGRSGIHHEGGIIADGKLRRFKANGDHDRNSWYILFAGPPMAGALGCWKRGTKMKWCEKAGDKYTEAQWRQIKERWKEAETKAEEEEKRRREQTVAFRAFSVNFFRLVSW
jgi:phage/plasmid primase-like uncharacterized protein